MFRYVDFGDISADEDYIWNQKLTVFYHDCLEWFQHFPSNCWFLLLYLPSLYKCLFKRFIATLVLLLSVINGIHALVVYKGEFRIIAVLHYSALFISSIVSLAFKKGSWAKECSGIEYRTLEEENLRVEKSEHPIEVCANDEEYFLENSFENMLEPRPGNETGSPRFISPARLAAATFNEFEDQYEVHYNDEYSIFEESQASTSAKVRTFQVHHNDEYSIFERSCATASAGPSQASTSAGPSQASTSAGPSQASTSAGPSQASTSAGPSQASTSAGPSQASTSAGPSQASTSAAKVRTFQVQAVVHRTDSYSPRNSINESSSSPEPVSAASDEGVRMIRSDSYSNIFHFSDLSSESTSS